MVAMQGKREMRFIRDASGEIQMIFTVDGFLMEVPEPDPGFLDTSMTADEMDEQEEEARRIVEDGGIERLDASRFTVSYERGGVDHEQTVDVCWVLGAAVEEREHDVAAGERIAAVDCTCRISGCVHQVAVKMYLGDWE